MSHRPPRLVAPVVLAALFVGAAARAAPSTAMPLSHHGAAHGYRVGLPVDWAAMPDAALAARSRAARKAGAPDAMRFDSAFQVARGRRPSDYPCVIVQVLPYGKLGRDRQVREDEFPDVVREMAGTNLRLARAQSLKSHARLDAPVLERSRRRYWMNGEMNVAGPGPVRTLIAGYFGRDAIVQVCFYAKAVDWDRHAATGRRICESLTFDPAKGYPDAAAPANPAAANEVANGAANRAAATPATTDPTIANPAATNRPATNPAPRGGSGDSSGAKQVAVGVIGGVAVGLVSHAVRQRQRRLRIQQDEIDAATNRPRQW